MRGIDVVTFMFNLALLYRPRLVGNLSLYSTFMTPNFRR